MNGGARHGGDRLTRDQQADAPTPPSGSEANRRTMLSLPSLRGTDTPLSSSYSHNSHNIHNAAHHAQAPGQGHAQAQAHATTAASNSFNFPSGDKVRGAAPAAAASDPFGRPISNSNSNSQDTNITSSSTNDSDLNSSNNVFTPPASASDGGRSIGNESANHSHESSQESQLFQLSQLAAAQEKMPADVGSRMATSLAASPVEAGVSRKRLVDGTVKPAREASSASPVFSSHGGGGGGHSRNTSTVSMASTAGSRIGELSSELKARLAYAMVKVNNGWQSHSIDQVESLSLASQAASPVSTVSTIHGRHGSSASPRLPSAASHRSNSSISPTGVGVAGVGQRHQLPGSAPAHSDRSGSTSAAPNSRSGPSLAPPAPIQPSRSTAHDARRNSNSQYTPMYLSHAGYHASPRTPADGAGSVHGTPRQPPTRPPIVDPILYASPHQNVREQDAIESLLFMSSPGNSANLKHSFPSSSSQPVGSTRATTATVASSSQPAQRTALPTGQPRKSLPSGRPAPHSSSQPTKRVGFEKSPSNLSEMDVDDHHYGSPQARGTPRRRVNGHGHSNSHSHSHSIDAHAQARHRLQLSVPMGLTPKSKRRPVLADEDIEKMLDRCAAEDSSDSEGEIQIPIRRSVART